MCLQDLFRFALENQAVGMQCCYVVSSTKIYTPLTRAVFLLCIQFSRDILYKRGLVALVEVRRFELLTPCVQGRCSPVELYPQVLLLRCNKQWLIVGFINN